MTQTIPCPHCRRQLNIQEGQLGQQVRCPACQHIFTAAFPPSPMDEVVRDVSAVEAAEERPGGSSRATRPQESGGPLDFGDDDQRPTLDEDDDYPRGRSHHGVLVLMRR